MTLPAYWTDSFPDARLVPVSSYKESEFLPDGASSRVGDPLNLSKSHLGPCKRPRSYRRVRIKVFDKFARATVTDVEPEGLRSPPTDEEMAHRQERTDANVARARRTISDHCHQINANNLMTLTRRGGFPTVDSCWISLKSFVRRCRRVGVDFNYVAVPEQHANGTYHLHLAVHGYLPVKVLRRQWYRALGGEGDETGASTPGAINLSKRCGSPDHGVARYLAKYVGKSLIKERKGRRAYSSRRAGTAPPVTVDVWLPINASDEEVEQYVESVVGTSIKRSWFGYSAGGYVGVLELYPC